MSTNNDCTDCEDGIFGNVDGEILYCDCEMGKPKLLRYLLDEKRRLNEIEKDQKKINCGSCHNTGHHKGELGNYCFNCVWGELLIKESTRLFIENHKKFVENMIPNCQYTDDLEDCKSKCIEHLNHLKI